MFKKNPRNQEILKALRARIFLSDQREDIILRETALAREFGLSRTPIRQMLQALSHEHLVEVKTGIGTVATKLNPAHRDRDFMVYTQIALAASALPCTSVTSEIKVRLMGISQLAEAEVREAGDTSLELFVRLAQESADATRQIVAEPILSSAFAAARWRIIRWRILDYHDDLQGFWNTTLSNFARSAAAASEGDAKAYLETIAGVVDEMRA